MTELELAAVLFDMDGTLVDSEKMWSVGLTELAAHYGAELSASARSRMVGTDMPTSMRILHDDIDQPWRDSRYSTRWLEERVRDLFAGGLPWRPGARELLDSVRAAGLPTALVTATHRHLVDVALGTLGSENFDAVVVGDEVSETKPHPMPYLTAAELLGGEPGRCIAIEDSPNGIASASAAGCVVVGVPCEVELPARDDVTLVDSLATVDVEFLRRLVAARG